MEVNDIANIKLNDPSDTSKFNNLGKFNMYSRLRSKSIDFSSINNQEILYAPKQKYIAL